MKNWLSIGEFGKATGLTIKALRIYEEKGILIPHTRSESRYRVYTAEQTAIAQQVVQFKRLGFSLEQIKLLLQETDGRSLQEILERRLQESRVAVHVLVNQIESLETILTSLKLGQELSEHERSQIMNNVLEVSVNNLKRKGIVDQNSIAQVSEEVSLYSPEKIQFINGFRKILEFAKKKNILLGPGRGNSGGSLVLFAEGYSPMNPLKYGLLPELFSESKYIWLDVEYSQHQEIGQMCDALAAKTGFEVIAYRSPILDIFKKLEKQIGKIEFDSFSDLDPMILQAPKMHGTRGLFWLEWNPNFHAFQDMPSQWQQEHNWENDVLEEFYAEHGFKSPMDYIVLDGIKSLEDKDLFFSYPQRTVDACPDFLPELTYTKGLLIFREDWIKLLAKHAGVSITEANRIQRALSKDTQGIEREILEQIAIPEVKNLLLERVKKVYSKAHAITGWWHYKRTAILKSLWPKEYLAALEEWETEHKMVWFEFGYKTTNNSFYLKANS